MIGIGQGTQAAAVLADKAVALVVNGGRTIGRGAPIVLHGGGGLSASGAALLAVLVAGAVAAVLLGRAVRSRTAAPADERRMTGVERGTIVPGYGRGPAAVRARRPSGGEDGQAQARDERR